MTVIRHARRLSCLTGLMLLVALSGCDSGPAGVDVPAPVEPVVPPPVEPSLPTVERFALRDFGAFQEFDWTPLSSAGSRSCRDQDDRATRPIEGDLQIVADRFVLRVILQDLRQTGAPNVVLSDSGTVEQHSGLVLFHSVAGPTMYGTLGPDPAAPTTVTFHDTGARPCHALRFAAGSLATSVSGQTTLHETDSLRFVSRNGNRSHASSEWLEIPYYLGGCTRQPCGRTDYLERGYVRFTPDGRYTTGIEVRDRVSGTSEWTNRQGTYLTAGQLVFLDPGSIHASYGELTSGELRLSNFNFFGTSPQAAYRVSRP